MPQTHFNFSQCTCTHCVLSLSLNQSLSCGAAAALSRFVPGQGCHNTWIATAQDGNYNWDYFNIRYNVFLLYPSYKLQKLNMLASLYVYSLMVQSAPVEKIQGCMGCQLTSRTPNSSRFSCVCSFLSGTIKGFCSKSLKEQKVEWIKGPS